MRVHQPQDRSEQRHAEQRGDERLLGQSAMNSASVMRLKPKRASMTKVR